MSKPMHCGNPVSRASKRRIRDWIWWWVLLAFVEVLTTRIAAPYVDLRAWLNPGVVDALSVVDMLLVASAVAAMGVSCYLGIFAELARWLHIERKAAGRTLIAAADAMDITRSQDAVQFVGRCRSVIRRASRRSPYAELGAVGNLKAALAHSQSVTKGHRGQGRQTGAAPATRSKAGSKAADDEGDGEPPQQLFYTYGSFSKLFGVAPQTLRNKVSAGLFPAPVKTAFGPRFTQQHLDYALHSPRQTDDARPRGRGRPRIARSLGKGGAR